MPNIVQNSELEIETQIRRLADYERFSGIFWIVLGIIQILCIITIIPGIWNFIAGLSRLKRIPAILARDEKVPDAFEDIVGYILIALVNLILGAAIGILFVIFDLYVRDQVLSRRNLFQTKTIGGGNVQNAAYAPQGNLSDKNIVQSANLTVQDLEKLEHLAKMHNQGILTEEEFQQAKSKIL